MKRIASLILVIVLFLTLVPKSGMLAARSGCEYESSYGAGLIWDPLEIIEEKLRAGSQSESALPLLVDLKDEFPMPEDQGKQNSCVAWAVAYALRSHQEDVKRRWGLNTDSQLFSPSYIYNQCNNGVNDGMSIGGAMNLLVDQGVCSLHSFPCIRESDLAKSKIYIWDKNMQPCIEVISGLK